MSKLIGRLLVMLAFGWGGVLFSPSLLSAGLSGFFTDGGAEPNGRLSPPQVVNQAQDIIGTYGGLATTLNLNGEPESVFLVILKQGYVVPIVADGEIATVGQLYYSEENCNGREFVAPAKENYMLQPMGGVLYKSPATLEVNYIPKFQEKEEHTVGSGFFYKTGSTPLCKNQRESVTVFPTKSNDSQVTGFAPSVRIGTVAIMDQSQSRTGKLKKRQSGTESIPNQHDLDQATLPEIDTECSTSCFTGDIGNKVCDIDCNVQACSFDGGDCSSLSDEDIQAESAKRCSAGCLTTSIDDGFCDSACNNASCNYDGNDCSSN